MDNAAFGVRTGLVWLALLGAAGLTLGCEQFDPVRSDNLCERTDDHAISMHCPQCAKPPFDWRCSVCYVMKDPDPAMCAQTDQSPSTAAGRGGEGGAGEGGAGEGGSGASDAGQDAGTDAGSAGAGAGGSGGMSMPTAGADAGAMVDPTVCTGNLWCMARDESRPICKAGVCVECTDDADCGGRVCDPSANRCQDCFENGDCGSRVCDTQRKLCVQCTRDPDCTDEVMDNCDTRTFECRDCVTDSGCMNNDTEKTCNTSTFTCVDCLDDRGCNEQEGKHACDVQARTCVQCMNDTHCIDGVLDSCDVEARTCVDCVNNEGCSSGPNRQCDVESQTCVECVLDDHCPSGHCSENRCVECKVDADCPDADASYCDPETHTCEGCTSNAHCAHLPSTRACDISERTCVECTNDSTCGGKACIRSTNQCSDVDTRSVSVCGECQADSMCMANMRCVALSFGGESYGSHCVYERSTRSGGSCSNARPYTRSVSARSIDQSTTATYCVPPSATSCPGVLDTVVGASGSVCSDSVECGLGRGDAVCLNQRCTYSCSGIDNNCPERLSCVPGEHCG